MCTDGQEVEISSDHLQLNAIPLDRLSIVSNVSVSSKIPPHKLALVTIPVDQALRQYFDSESRNTDSLCVQVTFSADHTSQPLQGTQYKHEPANPYVQLSSQSDIKLEILYPSVIYEHQYVCVAFNQTSADMGGLTRNC